MEQLESNSRNMSNTTSPFRRPKGKGGTVRRNGKGKLGIQEYDYNNSRRAFSLANHKRFLEVNKLNMYPFLKCEQYLGIFLRKP